MAYIYSSMEHKDGFICDWCGKYKAMPGQGSMLPGGWKRQGLKTFCSQRCLMRYKTDHPGGCFITTAVCQSRNLPDNCEELTLLRKFRDDWMCREGLQNEIDEYYETAPKICTEINKTPGSAEIYDSIYERWIKKSVDAIKSGMYAEAHEIYKGMVMELRGQWIVEENN
ncbi:MAG TPA: hypothetical protein DCF70_01645 [Treponema sp.]|nr:hypothetical protein [Treponema sp.]